MRLLGLPLAVQFLTVVPVPTRLLPRTAIAGDGAPSMAPALPWFPLVGAALGALLAAIDWLLAPVLSLGVRDVLLLALGALLTGLLHLDGFVDCCDALLGARSVARRLDILRDSHAGAYGALGGALLLLARFAALGALAGDARPLALVIAPLLGRWAMAYAVTRYPYARAEGVGAPFRAGARHLAGASLVALALLALTGAAAGAAGFALAAPLLALLALLAVAITLGWARWASRRLGGALTGDTYGALNELVELGVLALTPPFALLAARLL